MPVGEIGEVEKLGVKMLRPEKRINDEDLIASELACAVVSDPLGKIRHVCEALWLLDEEERRMAGITEGEVEEAGRLYRLVTAFQTTTPETPPSGHGVRTAVFTWPFSIEEAERWKEWLCPPAITIRRVVEDREENRRLKEMIQRERPPEWVENYLLTHAQRLTADTVEAFQTHFIANAMPKAARVLRKIIRLVSPDSYRQALRNLRGGKHAKA